MAPTLRNVLIRLASAGGNHEAAQSFISRRVKRNIQTLHQGKGDSRCAVARLLLGGDAGFELPACDRLRTLGRAAGVHTRGRLDDFSHVDSHPGGSYTLPLDLDGCATGPLANAHGLLDCPASYGT